jgi:hypothetical protein
MFDSEKVRDFVKMTLKQGFITKRSQKLYGSMGYYLAIWNLRDAGVIAEDGYDESKQKIWKLTLVGQKLAKLFMEADELNKKIDKLVRREVI